MATAIYGAAASSADEGPFDSWTFDVQIMPPPQETASGRPHLPASHGQAHTFRVQPGAAAASTQCVLAARPGAEPFRLASWQPATTIPLLQGRVIGEQQAQDNTMMQIEQRLMEQIINSEPLSDGESMHTHHGVLPLRHHVHETSGNKSLCEMTRRNMLVLVNIAVLRSSE